MRQAVQATTVTWRQMADAMRWGMRAMERFAVPALPVALMNATVVHGPGGRVYRVLRGDPLRRVFVCECDEVPGLRYAIPFEWPTEKSGWDWL